MRSGELSRVRANPVREERVFSSVRRFGGVKLCAKRNMLSSAPKRPPIFVGGFLLVFVQFFYILLARSVSTNGILEF